MQDNYKNYFDRNLPEPIKKHLYKHYLDHPYYTNQGKSVNSIKLEAQKYDGEPLHSYQFIRQDIYGSEKIARFNRERIPERVAYANGSGAHGVFEATHDLSRYTCAKIFSRAGKKTEMIARFSALTGERGSPQSVRDLRGFALKFYTEEGNLDIAGSNSPVFFIRDPMKFPDLIHSQKRDPASNLYNPDYFWDFISLTPEAIHQTTLLYSPRGIPKSFRHMHGYGTNTYMWYNEKNEHIFVKYHFLSGQGIQNLTDEDAAALAGKDSDSATRDLRDAIARGDFPSWSMHIQIMTPEQADNCLFDPFDATKAWPHKDFPLVPAGKFTLNRNPENFFEEIEQLAFSPAHMVRGVGPSPDKMLQGKMFGCTDAERYRLGANFLQIPVNAPKNAASGRIAGGKPDYFPSSFSGGAADSVPPVKIEGTIKHRADIKDADFIQAGEFYRRVLNQSEKDALIDSISRHLGRAKMFIQYRQCCLFYKADADYGMRAAKALGLDFERVKYLSALPLERRIKETMQ